MSRVKFSENMFLEVNELKRLVKFIGEDGYKKVFKAVVKSPGIVRNELNTNFKPTKKEGSSNIVKINRGLAYDDDFNAIESNEDIEVKVNNSGIKQWLVLSKGVTNNEKGFVSVKTDGSMSGVGTEFTEVLRGQPNFPTKVKFNKGDGNESNFGEYEVVKVISDTSAILSGSFSNETGLNFSVIGTFTPGFQPLIENKMIYEYDSYSIKILESAETPTLPKGEYLIAGVYFDLLGEINVDDERVVNMFNEDHIQGDNGNSSIVSTDSSVSLLSVSNIGSNEKTANLELIFEHGYNVSDFELLEASGNKVFNIKTGGNNFFGTGIIPDGFFKGWILLNRSNMKHIVIDDNINKDLIVSKFQSSITDSTISDFVIVPNFDEVEYEVKVSNNLENPSTPFYFKSSIWNINSRVRIYSYFKSVDEDNFNDVITVSVKSRMLSYNDRRQNKFRALPISQFKNIHGAKETLSSSSFKVNVSEIELIEKQRNYS